MFLFVIFLCFFAKSFTNAMVVNSNSAQKLCQFPMYMGEKYNKCSAICEGRNYKCVADGTCLCQSCPNEADNAYVHTHEDVSCEFTQECSRKCMEVNSEPEYNGNIGRGKMCHFTDDFYGKRGSVCACACL